MDPLTLIYLALMAAGTGAQYMGAKKVDKERAHAMGEERIRREKKTRENEASAAASQQLFADQATRESAKAAQLETQLNPRTTAAPTAGVNLLDTLAPTTSASTIQTASDLRNENNAYIDAIAKGRAKFGAYGAIQTDNAKAMTRNAQDMGANAQSMQNWNNLVLPAQLNAANESGRGWNTAGDVMKLAAMVMGPWALGGGGTSSVSGGNVPGAADVGAGAAGGSPFDPYSMLHRIKARQIWGGPF